MIFKYIFFLFHIFFIFLSVIGPFWYWQVLLLQFLTIISWKLNNNKCIITQLEDYLFKCKLFKSSNIAKKLDEDLAYYRILDKSRSSKKLKNIYWLWHINKKFNKLKFFDNLMSIFSIALNSIKKYGIK